MPTLACHVCGRVVETTKALESLSADERRCPRCGSTLDVERRSGERPDRRKGDRRKGDRRESDRRKNPHDNPGPPGGIERRVAERRVAERRVAERRGADRRQGPRRREGG